LQASTETQKVTGGVKGSKVPTSAVTNKGEEDAGGDDEETQNTKVSKQEG